jgi:hypothetical protein
MIKSQELNGIKRWVGLLSASVAIPAIVGIFVALDANLISHVALGAAAVGLVSTFEIKHSLDKRKLE